MHMLEEILSQPAGVEKTIEGNLDAAKKVKADIGDRNVDFVLILARGTSDNAATYAKYLLGLVNGLPVGLAAPSLMNLYSAPLALERALVISISQSGETDEILQATRFAKERGAYCLGITNEARSSLAETAHTALLCRTGREQSIPATKTYTGELTALCVLSFTLAERNDLLDSLAEVPRDLAGNIERLDATIALKAERYRFMERCLVLGRGLNYATALETALKLKETCSVGAEALSAADFLHGPIAALGEGYPVIVFAPSDETVKSVRSIVERLGSFKCETICISDDADILAKAALPLETRARDPLFWPFSAIVPAQLLSYRLALVKGLDPDRPRGLSKVTASA